MKIRSAQLKTVCGYTSTLPEPILPEIAFAGRSNVGKSSLINTLMQRKRLARVGETPGKTRTINFYEVDALVKRGEEEREVFSLVDLPGYGYANVPQEEKKRWGKMIERYLRSDRGLLAVFLLMDIRHEPNANDRQMYDWILQSGHTPVLVATKADKVKRSQTARCVKVIREGVGAPKDSIVLPFSAQSGSGREEICARIAQLLERKS